MLFSTLLTISQVHCQNAKEQHTLHTNDANLKPNTKFDIVYLNMEKATDRDQHIRSLFTNANCTFSRFNAVDGKALKTTKKVTDYTNPLGLDQFADFVKFDHFDDNRMGMIGCKLSHYLNIRNIEKSGTEKPVLIVEDDIDVEFNFVSKIEEALEELPADWDILLITGHYNTHQDNKYDAKKKTVEVGYFFECLGFLVNGSKSAKKIADIIQKNCADYMPIDLFLAYEAIPKNINVYAIKRRLSMQRRDLFGSSIATSQEIYSHPLDFSLNDYLKLKME